MIAPESYRIAVVGSGPAGMYTARHLLSAGIAGTYLDGRMVSLTDRPMEVDMFDKLPTPFGLIRGGVAPDHPDKKLIGHLFESVATREGFRFWGNIDVGRDIGVDELARWYDAVILAVGAAADAPLGIAGEELPGSLSAREFVGWSNGTPEYAALDLDLDTERAVIIGNGNVALDVARVLATPPATLRRTDIAEHAAEELQHSRIREVVVLGRRGHLAGAFAATELEALGDLPGVDVVAHPQDLATVETIPDAGPLRRKQVGAGSTSAKGSTAVTSEASDARSSTPTNWCAQPARITRPRRGATR